MHSQSLYDDCIFSYFLLVPRLIQMLSTEVKVMRDIPIELGLAKLTSIRQTSNHVTVTQIQSQKERDRQTMTTAFSSAQAESAAKPLQTKIYIAGLEKL